MNQIDPSKYENIIKKKSKCEEKNKVKRYLINLASRTLITLIILISIAVIYKSNNSLKDNISKSFFTESISFTKINKIYNQYLGGILPIKKTNNTQAVFNEKLEYDASSIYCDGVKLSVADNYLVSSVEEGMVVFIGNKENYGNTIIIEDLNGVDYWYGNITNTSLKLYDYVEKGHIIGEANKELYMVFSKDGKFLNYEEYIK